MAEIPQASTNGVVSVRGVLKGMAEHPHDKNTQEEGCIVLSKVSWTGKQTNSLVNDCATALLRAMRNHLKSPLLQAKACLALGNMACNNTTNQQVIVAHDGIATVLSTMSALLWHAQVQINGASVVANVCSTEEYRQQLIALGAVDVIRQSIKAHPSQRGVTDNCKWALDNLTLFGTDVPPELPPKRPSVAAVEKTTTSTSTPKPSSSSSTSVLSASQMSSSSHPLMATDPGFKDGALQGDFHEKLKENGISISDVCQYSTKDLDELLRDVFKYGVIDRNKLKNYVQSQSKPQPLTKHIITSKVEAQPKTSASEQETEKRITEKLKREELKKLSSPPQEFLCTISGDIMEDPVFTSDGHTYERVAIMQWFEHSRVQGKITSPNTGLALPNTKVIPNHVLRSQIIAWQEKKEKLEAELGIPSSPKATPRSPTAKDCVSDSSTDATPPSQESDNAPSVRPSGLHVDLRGLPQPPAPAPTHSVTPVRRVPYSHPTSTLRQSTESNQSGPLSGRGETSLRTLSTLNTVNTDAIDSEPQYDLYAIATETTSSSGFRPSSSTRGGRPATHNLNSHRARIRAQHRREPLAVALGGTQSREDMLRTLRAHGSGVARQLANTISGVRPFRDTIV
eukprot:TRINITY_DN49239_c0_g1_i1.p1 TRINITY_DN49239_c0_g1~~TRINITY_DN49239_c0_g1_i1.p1  ORF type:complete len:625 (-),score=9.50 TRINITY_DN49239_c0_g1_i1:64-1938(-)